MTDRLDQAIVQGWRDGTPMKRGGSPDEVVDACVFLLRYEHLHQRTGA